MFDSARPPSTLNNSTLGLMPRSCFAPTEFTWVWLLYEGAKRLLRRQFCKLSPFFGEEIMGL